MDYSLLNEQKISEKFEDLPQDLKNVLSSINTSIAIENIAEKYHLDEEKTTMLIQLVGLVILGFASFENMKEEMKETIDISPQFIPLIADEIRQKIFSPVINSLQKIITGKRPPATTPATPAMPAVPATPVVPPTPTSVPSSKFQVPSADQYREPTIGPEIVDLRNQPKAGPRPANLGLAGPPRAETPPAVSKVEPPPLPISSPTLSEQRNRGSSISQPRQGGEEIGTMTVPPAPVPTPQPKAGPPRAETPPLTFTRPVEPATPLIEAEPHKILTPTPKPIDTYKEPTETQGPPLVSAPIPISTPPASEPRPQYIMRPSGAPPTDLPDNVLDLRKDKGEF